MSGTPMIIDEAVRAKIRYLASLARSRPVQMMGLGERLERPLGKELHMKQMSEQTITIPLAFPTTFSVETGHPCGTCRHMSMSVQRQGRLPNEHALWLVAQEFGFWGSLKECTLWMEELAGHGEAINVVQPLKPEELQRWFAELS